MKKLLYAAAMLLMASAVAAQVSPETLAKREKRKNLTVKEWNTDQASKTRWLDRETTYDEQGRKIEEVEYASYGQKWRITYKYGETSGKVEQEVEYDGRDKPVKVRKYEYNADGTKRRQYNYSPNGKLQTVKVFEYIFKDAADKR